MIVLHKLIYSITFLIFEYYAIYFIFIKLLIYITVETEILHYVSKKIINYYDRDFINFL